MNNIIGIEEAKELNAKNVSIKCGNRILDIKDFENGKLYIKMGEKYNPIDSPSNLIKVKEICEDTIDEAFNDIKKNNGIKLSEMETKYLLSTIYALEYRGKIKIENDKIYSV